MEAKEGLRSIILGFLFLGLVLSFSNSQKPKSSCHFRAIFNFGDSNSDTGGLAAAFNGPILPPDGETYFHHSAGRFSDGRLTIDFIAKSLRLPYLHPYLDSVGSNFSHGVNFATAGSTIRPQMVHLSPSTKNGYSPISLNIQQIQYSYLFNRTKNITTQGGVFSKLLPHVDYFANGLYTFDIGQNDLTAGYDLNMTTDQVKTTVPDIISQYIDVIKGVYAMGGRSFWIHNTGPVGCYPYIKQYKIPLHLDKNGCATNLNDVSQYFNQLLKAAVIQLRKDLPQAAFTYVDMYSLKYSLFLNYKELGFPSPFVPCCSNMTLVKEWIFDPKAIVWDGTHFTEKANYWVFQQIYNGSFSDPPTPIYLACP